MVRVRHRIVSAGLRLGLAALVLAAAGCAAGRLIRDRLPRPGITPRGVLFRYEAPAARQVNLAGQWNNWGGTQGGGRFDPSIDPMTGPDAGGIWSITIPLAPGRYQYKFVIDQVRWEQDPSNPDKGVDGGIENSLVLVPSGTAYEVPAIYATTVTGSAALTAAPARAEARGADEKAAPAAPAPGEVKVSLRFKAADAKAVYLAGSFNDWSADKLLMTKGEDGVWTVTLSLAPGTYPYKFVVDGTWKPDPDNPDSVDDGYGGVNSVLTVAAAAAADTVRK